MMTTRQYFTDCVLRELHRFAAFEPVGDETDSPAKRYLRDYENTPDYESDDEANNRMTPFIPLLAMFKFE